MHEPENEEFGLKHNDGFGKGEIEKFSWRATGTPLIDQARNALKQNKYPLFASEGDHNKKFSRIMHNTYKRLYFIW